MNGIEMGNIFGNTAVMRQKDSRAETKNVRAGQSAREASAGHERTGQQDSGNGNGVSWVRDSGFRHPGSAGNAAWGHAGNQPATNRPGSAGSNAWNHVGNQPGKNRPHNAGNAVWNLTGKDGVPNQAAPDKTGKPDPAGKEPGSGKKPMNQTGSYDQKAGQAGKNGQNAINQTAQPGIASNRIGEMNNLSMVDRQRLAQQKRAKAKAKKKNLNYNRREVSAQVLRASKLGMAARALATARTKVSTLRRCVGTGQYDENELRIAIAHAESIVKTAKKKLGNLKEEQVKEKRVAREKQANALKKQIKKQRVRAKRQQIKRELATQRNQAERQMKMKEMRCKQLKRRHRGEEQADVAEADIKYIKDMNRYRRYGGTESSGRNVTDTTGTAALEISDSAMRLSDLERVEQALKYEEQQMGQEAADFYGNSAAGSVDYSVGDGVPAGDAGGGEISVDMGSAGVGGAVDISL